MKPFEPSKIPHTRWGPCPHCGAAGWWLPSHHKGANPMHEHDRPQGGRCLKALTGAPLPKLGGGQ